MWWYNISIYIYSSFVRSATHFNEKAKLFVEGRRGLFDRIKTDFKNNKKKTAWFHAASLGEFEQGRPVIERFKKEFPDYLIVLTFYSPSGYELRKNYKGSDFVYYLPIDTSSNVREFIECIDPSIAFFIKYEFWPNYIKELAKRSIPLLSFSTIFRADQVFFKWYGKSYRNLLLHFQHIFVQNQDSAQLLDSIGISNYQITGDTRFDRVNEIAQEPKHLPEIKIFIQDHPCMVVGSSWPEDIEVLLPIIQNNSLGLKFIIAPHEIDGGAINFLEKKLNQPCTRYSQIEQGAKDSNILIIDSIGLLSSIYQFADVAFIGGAYGKGLHNTLEASIYRIPVFFGDHNYKKFQEAMDLIHIGAAYSIESTARLEELLTSYFENQNIRNHCKSALDEYIHKNLGTSEKIISYCKEILQ